MDQVADPPEELQDHIPDLRPVGYKHGHQRAKMQQDIKKARNLRGSLHAQQLLRNGQMAGTGNWQKFRHALNQPQQNGMEQGHTITPYTELNKRHAPYEPIVS